MFNEILTFEIFHENIGKVVISEGIILHLQLHRHTVTSTTETGLACIKLLIDNQFTKKH